MNFLVVDFLLGLVVPDEFPLVGVWRLFGSVPVETERELALEQVALVRLKKKNSSVYSYFFRL